MDAHIHSHSFDAGTDDSETVLYQLYQAYQEFHKSDPPEIRNHFQELNRLLKSLPLDDNDVVFPPAATCASPTSE